MTASTTMLIPRSRIASLLPMRDCIDAVEAAFRCEATGRTIPAGVLGTSVGGGGFHVKTAGLRGTRAYFVAKINANFPDNPRQSGRPTIQGVLVLFDANDGAPLAIMDSAEITRLRTGAATAVAAKYLARTDAATVTICGCGLQGRAQLEALCAVRPIGTALAYDIDRGRAREFAEETAAAFAIDVRPVASVAEGALTSDVIVTCTSARTVVLESADVRPGTFVAAVGADSEDKQELAPTLLARSAVYVDVLAQCARIGDLHHALLAGAMRAEEVRGDLAGLVGGRVPGRSDAAEITIFDSTGTALEDVAAAALVYERALGAGATGGVDLTG
jgi:alanine dehydrogenase